MVRLNPLRVIPTTLAKTLLETGARSRPQSGYITFDQSRKVALLTCLKSASLFFAALLVLTIWCTQALLTTEKDPKAFELPLVGIWVAGVENLHDAYVRTACLRYAYRCARCSALLLRALKSL